MSKTAPGVLLTRPEGLNEGLAATLGDRGISVMIEPLLKIAPLAPNAEMQATIQDLSAYDALVFVSRHAVTFTVPLLENWWPQWPLLDFYAVGSGTAEALAEFDISAAYPPQAGSEGLLSLPGLVDAAGMQVLIVRGRGGRDLLRTTLVARGAEVAYLESYERKPVHDAALAGKMRRRDIGLAVVTSGEILGALANSLGAGELATLIVVVPSARVAEQANALGFARVVTAEGASEQALTEAVTGTLQG